jgi:LPXTG-motif cell wall-anchored protein
MSDRNGAARARSRRVLWVTLLAAPVAAVGSTVALYSPASAFVPPDPNVPFEGNLQICHAAGGSGNYSTPPPANVSGIISGHQFHAGDIIPPVLYFENGNLVFFPGLNWTAEGQAIYANDCVAVAPTTAAPTTAAPTTAAPTTAAPTTAAPTTAAPTTAAPTMAAPAGPTTAPPAGPTTAPPASPTTAPPASPTTAPPALPETGSSSTLPLAAAAAGLIAVGGLLVVKTRRAAAEGPER